MNGLDKILVKYSEDEVSSYLDGSLEFYNSNLFGELYHYFLPEMPYGVQTADDGEPEVWLLEQLGDYLDEY